MKGQVPVVCLLERPEWSNSISSICTHIRDNREKRVCFLHVLGFPDILLAVGDKNMIISVRKSECFVSAA